MYEYPLCLLFHMMFRNARRCDGVQVVIKLCDAWKQREEVMLLQHEALVYGACPQLFHAMGLSGIFFLVLQHLLFSVGKVVSASTTGTAAIAVSEILHLRRKCSGGNWEAEKALSQWRPRVA